MADPSNIPCYGISSISLPGVETLGLCSQPLWSVALFVMLYREKRRKKETRFALLYRESVENNMHLPKEALLQAQST
jgi:hypothetical protein